MENKNLGPQIQAAIVKDPGGFYRIKENLLAEKGITFQKETDWEDFFVDCQSYWDDASEAAAEDEWSWDDDPEEEGEWVAKWEDDDIDTLMGYRKRDEISSNASEAKTTSEVAEPKETPSAPSAEKRADAKSMKVFAALYYMYVFFFLSLTIAAAHQQASTGAHTPTDFTVPIFAGCAIGVGTVVYRRYTQKTVRKDTSSVNQARVFKDAATLITDVNGYSSHLAQNSEKLIKEAKAACAGSEGAMLTPALVRVQEIEKKYLPETLTLYLDAAKSASTQRASDTALKTALASVKLMREACDIPEAKYKEESAAQALESNKKFLEETFYKTEEGFKL